MSRRLTDQEKAEIFIELKINDGNIKKTARNINKNVSTIRYWKNEWEKKGVPQSILDEIDNKKDDFIDDAKRVRGKMLDRLEYMLDKREKSTVQQLVTGVGILTDKIRVYENINEPKKVEHTLKLPPAEELKELFSGFIGGMITAARERTAEIEAFEESSLTTTTYRELPEPKENE